MKRKKYNGLYAILSYHYDDNETVYIPKYTKNINGEYVRDGDIALVYRFPVISNDNIVKLKVKLYDKNVIKVPEHCIRLMDGDVDGDAACCLVLDKDYEFKITSIENKKITNTTINFDYSKSRVNKFINILLNKDYNKWLKLYSDAVLRQKLSKIIPMLPGSIFKYLLSKHIELYQIDNKIYHKNNYITEYNDEYKNCDIWIRSVQEFMKPFYKMTTSIKHPNVEINLDELYSLYQIIVDKDIQYFENEMCIKQTHKYNIDYFEKYFVTDFQRSCYNVIRYWISIQTNNTYSNESI